MTKQQIIEDKRNQRNIGLEGEQFVLQYEKARLPKHLASMVYRLGEDDIAHGYDILSCKDEHSDGLDLYIEVKTYIGHPHFYWSENELESARSLRPHYCIYLVDYSLINDHNYHPTIIDNPISLFKEESLWSVQVNSYYFSIENADAIPTDWNESTIIVGCYRDETQLHWINDQLAYNVRLSKDLLGAVDHSNPSVQNPKYLILYSSVNQHIYYLYRLTGESMKVTLQQLKETGYIPHRNNPLAQYLIYGIEKELSSFYININKLTRQLGQWRMDYTLEDLLSGTPIYTKGSTLRYYMEKSIATKPHYSIDKREFAKDLYSNYGKPWNEDATGSLISLYQQGLTFAAISEKLCRAPWTIEQKLRELRYAGKLRPRRG